ncbi:hypothetical protein LUZ60_002853 [Juncus effusus]|nr:hypothetical protein LUZ60_002853 [Juncus effusus]
MLEPTATVARLTHHRNIPSFFSSPKSLIAFLWILGFTLIYLWQTNSATGIQLFRRASTPTTPPRQTIPVPVPVPVPVPAVSGYRAVVYNLTDFGAVGDGKTVNTEAFERAIGKIREFEEKGGGQLNVGAGLWLTAPFNLTSCMTLFLEQGAVILGIQNENYWPLMPPLPSYGFGREHVGPRYGSLIHGQNLKDVIITGNNGTIDGQGKFWWRKYRAKLLNYTRGPLVQIMWSRDIIISNITLKNSPFWTLHPYDCKNVTISNLTILAPIKNAPNTDGIDPDSCEDMLIENCYISTGDDGIAIKSGWDQYGIQYGRPSNNITIRNLIVRSVVSAGISIGSEMSGGISNISISNIHIWQSRRGVRIKTAPGRGAYVQNVHYQNITFSNLRVGIVIKTDYNEHPITGFDPKAVPKINNVSYVGIYGSGVRVPVRMQGSSEIPIRGVFIQNMSVGISDKKKHVFQCAFVEGRVVGYVFPVPCENLDLYSENGELVKASGSQNVSDIDYSF